MTDMPLATNDADQALVPTGIHWQASQATTLQNLVFNMPQANNKNTSSHVGIFMENGSGGFVSGTCFYDSFLFFLYLALLLVVHRTNTEKQTL